MARRLGLGSSASKLASLSFDPIEKMKIAYDQMCVEIEFQEGMNAGTHTRLNKDGSVKQYSVMFHMELVEKAANLAEKLLKYGYAPVKDGDDLKAPPVLHISLSDAEGSVFSLNHRKAEDGRETS